METNILRDVVSTNCQLIYTQVTLISSYRRVEARDGGPDIKVRRLNYDCNLIQSQGRVTRVEGRAYERREGGERIAGRTVARKSRTFSHSCSLSRNSWTVYIGQERRVAPIDRPWSRSSRSRISFQRLRLAHVRSRATPLRVLRLRRLCMLERDAFRLRSIKKFGRNSNGIEI